MDSAILINDSAISKLYELGYKEYAAQISGQSVEYNIERGNYNKAKSRMNLYESTSGYFTNGEIERGREVYYYFKGKYYLGIHRNDSAEYFFRKCLIFKDDPNMAVSGYHGLSLLFEQLGKNDSTAKYSMLAYNANDSSYQIQTASELLRMQSIYNYSIHQKEAKTKAEKVALIQRWFFCLVILIICLFCFMFFVHKNRKTKAIKKINLLKNKFETEKLLLRKEKEELNILLKEKNDLLKEESISSNYKENSLNAEIEKRGKTIIELQNRIEKYENDMKMHNIVIKEDDLQNAPIKEHLATYIIHPEKRPTVRLWKELRSFAKYNLPQIYLMLMNYDVSEREFRICILRRLLFRPGEISSLVNCSVSEVSLTRIRLLKKIFGISGKATDFDKRIMLMF